MCLADVLKTLRDEGFDAVTTAKIHYAIARGKVSRPELNGSLQYNFTENHLRELRRYFVAKKKAAKELARVNACPKPAGGTVEASRH